MSDRKRRGDIQHQVKFLRGRSLRRVWDAVQQEIHKLPTVLWEHRPGDFRGSPTDFIRAHYGKSSGKIWEPRGFTIADLDADPKLRAAYRKWVRKHPEDRLPLPEAGADQDHTLTALRLPSFPHE